MSSPSSTAKSPTPEQTFSPRSAFESVEYDDADDATVTGPQPPLCAKYDEIKDEPVWTSKERDTIWKTAPANLSGLFKGFNALVFLERGKVLTPRQEKMMTYLEHSFSSVQTVCIDKGHVSAWHNGCCTYDVHASNSPHVYFVVDPTPFFIHSQLTMYHPFIAFERLDHVSAFLERVRVEAQRRGTHSHGAASRLLDYFVSVPDMPSFNSQTSKTHVAGPSQVSAPHATDSPLNSLMATTQFKSETPAVAESSGTANKHTDKRVKPRWSGGKEKMAAAKETIMGLVPETLKGRGRGKRGGQRQ